MNTHRLTNDVSLMALSSIKKTMLSLH